MILGRWLTLASGLLLAALLSPVLPILPAHAQSAPEAEPQPTTLALDTVRRHADRDTPVSVLLTAQDEAGTTTPVVGATVRLERRVDGTWSEVALLVTDEAGAAAVEQTLAREANDNDFRAFYDGDVSYAPSQSGIVRAAIKRRSSRVSVRGPARVVDEKKVKIRLRWRTVSGLPVPGRLELFRRDRGEDWRRVRRGVRLGDDGRAVLRFRPRVDTKWRARGRAQDWVRGDRSRVHRVDNLPPGVPVSLPKAAPRPRVNLPDQARARGEGANPRVTRIPDRIWNQMTGRSWHRGCPVGRSSLRLLRINYWAYDGYRHRGELVAHADAVDNMRGALAAMYDRELPLRSLYRVDRFGWSKRLQGADDYRSMAAGNSSAFNCRNVVGRPGVRSPHAWGRALDLNTWENPYHASHGWTPNGWWPSHSHPRVAWRSREHVVVRILLNHGFRWTYGTADSQHFDVPAGSGRVIAPRAPACRGEVCH